MILHSILYGLHCPVAVPPHELIFRLLRFTNCFIVYHQYQVPCSMIYRQSSYCFPNKKNEFQTGKQERNDPENRRSGYLYFWWSKFKNLLVQQ